jgi:hypothetical protein
MSQSDIAQNKGKGSKGKYRYLHATILALLLGLGVGAGAVFAGFPASGTSSPPVQGKTDTTKPGAAQPQVCNYTVTAGTGTVVPGTTFLTGSNCDDCSVALPLPFPFTFYGTPFNSVNVISNGNLQFSSTNTDFTNACEPYAGHNNVIHTYWDDYLMTTAGNGVYTSVSGSAPNRILNIEWRACYYNLGSCGGPLNVEARLFEGSSGRIDVIYGVAGNGNASATGGVQMGTGSLFLQAYCNGAGLPVSAGVRHTYMPESCATATPTATPPCGTGSWIAGPNHPASPGIVRAVGVYFPANGRFYTMGGRTSDAVGSETTNPYEFTPGSPGTWATKAGVLPDNQTNNMACGVLTASGTPYIYCVGGSAAGATTATARVFRYNPATDVVSAVAAPWPGNPGGDTLPGGFAVVNNKLYIVGGFQVNVAMTNQTWEFNPVGNVWTAKANYPVARGYVPAAAIGTNIFTGGGSDYVGGLVVDTADSFKYDTVANAWTPIANIPRATGETRAVTMNGQMWVLGGGRTAPNPSNQVDVYNPGTNAWSAGIPFATARRNFPADSDGTTKIWLAGGYAPTTATNTMEIFQGGGPCPTPTPTACPFQFSDVPITNTFYSSVRCLACRGIVSGYADGTFRPNNQVTRGQLAKMVSNAAGFSEPVSGQTFEDVPPTQTFYQWIERLSTRGYMSGYVCGGPGEPCITGKPYFRPSANATRGQTSKIVSNAAGFIEPVSGQIFQDVPPTYTFYEFIQRLASRGVMGGYACGGAGEPCIPPDNRPYFRPQLDVTRGQSAKIVANAFYPGCVTPQRPDTMAPDPLAPNN